MQQDLWGADSWRFKAVIIVQLFAAFLVVTFGINTIFLMVIHKDPCC